MSDPFNGIPLAATLTDEQLSDQLGEPVRSGRDTVTSGSGRFGFDMATPISRWSPSQNAAIARLWASAAAYATSRVSAPKIGRAQNDEKMIWARNPSRSSAWPRSAPLNEPSAACHFGPKVSRSPSFTSSATVSGAWPPRPAS